MTKREIHSEVKNITKQLVARYHPIKIILFGSAAWGDVNEDSDLDFLIIKDNVPHYGRDRIHEIFGMINSDMALDFLVYKSAEFDERQKMGDPFINLIATKGRILYG